MFLASILHYSNWKSISIIILAVCLILVHCYIMSSHTTPAKELLLANVALKFLFWWCHDIGTSYLVDRIWFELYYCMIISRDALKLQIPRVLFHPKGRSPEGWRMNPRDLQFQCIPRNDHAVVFLHGLLNRQTASISHKKIAFSNAIPRDCKGFAKFRWFHIKIFCKSFAIPRVCKGFAIPRDCKAF